MKKKRTQTAKPTQTEAESALLADLLAGASIQGATMTRADSTTTNVPQWLMNRFLKRDWLTESPSQTYTLSQAGAAAFVRRRSRAKTKAARKDRKPRS